MLHDLRYALRVLLRSPIFSGMTVATLSLGIGMITALFAVTDAVLLRPIAADQDRLIRVHGLDETRGSLSHPFSFDEIVYWGEHSRSIQSIAAVQYVDLSTVPYSIGDQSMEVSVAPVSARFFEVVYGGPPLLGRWLDARDEVDGAERVAVASERFWRRVSGGDPAFVGRRLARAGGGQPVLIVGIAPAAVTYPLDVDLWTPLHAFYSSPAAPMFKVGPLFRQFHAIARIAPGVRLDQIQAELAVHNRQWTAEHPPLRATQIVVEPLLNQLLGDSRQVLLFLFAAAALVFVIAGVNVAALLLMRASNLRREVAVRIALGAGASQLLRQSIVESLLLGLLGAAGGILVAQACLVILRLLAPQDIPRLEDAALDARVFVFCVAAALVWVGTFGIAPLWRQRTHDMTAGVARADLSLRGVRGTAALRVFTVAQIASAVVVAVAAGLLTRSFAALQGIDRGYEARNLAVVDMLLPDARYPDAPARTAVYQQLVSRVGSLPGVLSAAPYNLEPGSGSTGLSAGLFFEGQTLEEARNNTWATWEPTLPSYFQTLGVPIIRGRGFSDADDGDSAPVVVISEAMAQRYFPGQDPIGKRLKFITSFPWATVVGVAADSRYRELTKAWMTVYFHAPQFFFFQPSGLVVRTSAAPEALLPAIRQTVLNLDRDIAISDTTTMSDLAAKELSRPRTALTVASLFALLAVLLAAVGVYGVMSYEVSQRRRELAVRSALGAGPDRIFRDVVRRSALIGATGALAGLAIAAGATRLLQAVLFSVSPLDATTFILGGGTLVVIVLMASYLPARRAANADPLASLRTE